MLRGDGQIAWACYAELMHKEVTQPQGTVHFGRLYRMQNKEVYIDNSYTHKIIMLIYGRAFNIRLTLVSVYPFYLSLDVCCREVISIPVHNA